MQTFEYVPSICRPLKGEDGKELPAEYEGSITLVKPSFEVRSQIVEHIFDGFGEDEVDLKELKGAKKIKYFRLAVVASKQFYKAVKIKRLKDGKEFKSFDELSFDQAFDTTLIEVASVLLSPEVSGN